MVNIVETFVCKPFVEKSYFISEEYALQLEFNGILY